MPFILIVRGLSLALLYNPQKLSAHAVFPWKVRCKPGKRLVYASVVQPDPRDLPANNIFLKLLYPLPVQVALQCFPPRSWPQCSSCFPSPAYNHINTCFRSHSNLGGSVLRISHQISNVGTVSDACHCHLQHTARTNAHRLALLRRPHRGGVASPSWKKKEIDTIVPFTVLYSGHFLEETFSYP